MKLTVSLASWRVMHAPSRLFDTLYECSHGRDTTKPTATRVIQRLPQEAVESSGVEFTGFSAEGTSML